MQVRYVGMFDSVEVPGLSPDPANVVVEVARGEVVAVPAGPEQLARAKGLLLQESNWQPADAEAEAAQREALAEWQKRMQDRERARAGLPPIEPEAAAIEPVGASNENGAAAGGKKAVR